MDVLHLQAMLDHSVQSVDDDFLREHKAHSPVDNLERASQST
jgi:hypothetical protein